MALEMEDRPYNPSPYNTTAGAPQVDLVSYETDMLHQHIDEIAQSINDLESRINPILRSMSPSAESTRPIGGTSCELAARLFSGNDKLAEIRERLDAIARRVAL